MSGVQHDRVESLTRAVVETPGVRGIYPQSVVAAATAGLVRSTRSAATGLLTIQQQGRLLVITARLAVDSTVPTRDVVTAVLEVLRRELGSQRFQAQIEIAHID